MHIPARVKKLLSILSWIVGIYRLSKDVDDDAKMDSSLKQISDSYCWTDAEAKKYICRYTLMISAI